MDGAGPPVLYNSRGKAMSGNVYDELKERGFVAQVSDDTAPRARAQAIHIQLARYLRFDGKNAIAVDNADWLLPLNYVAFLRDIGRHFSVNRMLAAAAYKLRLEKGLSFIEFNYQP